MTHPTVAIPARRVENDIRYAAMASLGICTWLMSPEPITPEDRRGALEWVAWALGEQLAKRPIRIDYHLDEMNAWQLARFCEVLIGAREPEFEADPPVARAA